MKTFLTTPLLLISIFAYVITAFRYGDNSDILYRREPLAFRPNSVPLSALRKRQLRSLYHRAAYPDIEGEYKQYYRRYPSPVDTPSAAVKKPSVANSPTAGKAAGEVKTLVISGFPGVGKSGFAEYNKDKKVVDLDGLRVNEYNWIQTSSGRSRNPDFPMNYVRETKKLMGTAHAIFLSSHQELRDALVKENVPFKLVYPAKSMKNEMIERYKKRGSAPAFIKLMEDKFDEFVGQCEAQKSAEHVVLKPGQYLSDVIKL
jgi:hypothetical protein